MDFTQLLPIVLALNSLITVYGSQPNIIFILGDDMGWNDVGYHNPKILTPNLDELAKNGLILEQNYVQPICTPSRAALMTGMYPYHIGRQDWILYHNWPTGLTLNRTLFPQALKSAGYDTHMVGKWHLGYCNEAYLPTNRGFDTHYGYWEGSEDYYTKTSSFGFDFHDGLDLITDQAAKETYSTYLYTDRVNKILDQYDQTSGNSSTNPMFMYLAVQSVHSPLQAPEIYENMYPDPSLSSNRRTFSAMMSAFDDLVGNLTAKLKSTGLYDNTVIIFSSDNGGFSMVGGSNEPLKGFKLTVYEGGTRVPAFVHSPLLQRRGVESYAMIHITDWFPTLLTLGQVPQDLQDQLVADIDGIDQYDTIFGPADPVVPKRDELVYNIQRLGTGNGTLGAIRQGEWKLFRFLGLSGDHVNRLYNVIEDPVEDHNRAEELPDLVNQMVAKYEELVQTMVPGDNPDGVDGNVDVDGNIVTGWCEVK